MARLTRHAQEQISNRPVVTEAEVLGAVLSKEREIVQARSTEVRVIVKTLKSKVRFPDGSNGDVVLACVDSRSLAVKTVMLQRASQVERKRRAGEAYL